MKIRILLFILVTFGLNSLITAQNISVVSWNIRDLGKSKTNEQISFIAQTLRAYDVIAIQEVVAKDPGGAQAVAKIADALNRLGNKWDYVISNPTKSPSSYIKERYAFIWKTSKVQLNNRPYLATTLQEVCHREPYVAHFKTKQQKELVVLNYHARSSKNHPEIEIPYLAQFMKELNHKAVMICGDFNLNETHPVFHSFYQIGFMPALKNTKTTLKRKCTNEFLSRAHDNFYFKNIDLINIKVLNTPVNCQQMISYNPISDHLPIVGSFSF